MSKQQEIFSIRERSLLLLFYTYPIWKTKKSFASQPRVCRGNGKSPCNPYDLNKMRMTGLEPARRRHQNLNLARLPIPSHPLILFYFLLWKKKIEQAIACSDERAGIRTPDNLIKSQVLYHLSYTPSFPFARKMPRTGIEPVTRGFSILCSTDWAIWAYT